MIRGTPTIQSSLFSLRPVSLGQDEQGACPVLCYYLDPYDLQI